MLALRYWIGSQAKIMERAIKGAWFLIVALCLFMTVGTAVDRVVSNAYSSEEVSLETVEDETAEKLHQRRRTNKAVKPSNGPSYSLPRRPVNVVAVLNKVSHRTERCRMNGFGGYLRN